MSEDIEMDECTCDWAPVDYGSNRPRYCVLHHKPAADSGVFVPPGCAMGVNASGSDIRHADPRPAAGGEGARLTRLDQIERTAHRVFPTGMSTWALRNGRAGVADSVVIAPADFVWLLAAARAATDGGAES